MANISKDNKVLTLINVFTVQPENQQRLLDLLVTATEEKMCKMPGFISASFHKSADGVRVVNYAQWQSREHWEVIFKDPEALKHVEESQRLAKADYHVYEVYSTHQGERD
jgi:quinol monooxygenase YgiN